jgi:hypothetical protein
MPLPSLWESAALLVLCYITTEREKGAAFSAGAFQGLKKKFSIFRSFIKWFGLCFFCPVLSFFLVVIVLLGNSLYFSAEIFPSGLDFLIAPLIALSEIFLYYIKILNSKRKHYSL